MAAGDAGRRRCWPTGHPGPAVFSPCGQYRYRLERILGAGPVLGIVMLNPSLAEPDLDDPTIDRVQTVCARFGFGRAIIGNLFAWQTPYADELASAADPVGPDNDRHLARLVQEADKVVVAWGAPGKFPAGHEHRWRDVVPILEGADKPLHCLTHLVSGHPRHPQILIHETPLPLWQRPE